MDQAFGGQGGGITLSPEDKRALAFGFAGIAKPQTADDIVWEGIKAKIPNASPEELPGLVEALKTRDVSKIPTTGFKSQTFDQLNTVNQWVAPEIEGIRQLIRKNNWDISNVDSQMIQSTYNSLISKLQGLNVKPDVIKMVKDQLDQTVQAALEENGVFFTAAGTESLRGRLGLPGGARSMPTYSGQAYSGE